MRTNVAILFVIARLLQPLAAEPANREQMVLESQVARVVVDLGGGSIGEFQLHDLALNPLSWATPTANDQSVHGFGHFLCLDRWGPPSDAERTRGMPYHGEASNVRWRVEGQPKADEVIMSARLPKAGLAIRRTIRLSTSEALFSVREEVKNENDLGRLLNMVQHPTIAPPFLDEKTVVDCNGTLGFAQGGALPDPEKLSARWPNALRENKEKVSLRYLRNDPNPNVVSFAIEEKLGWVTAANAGRELLIGYLWRTTDYPWVSLWRDVRENKPAARGLEFGTTGLHQPFPILVKKNRIWDRPLFEYLDAAETMRKDYLAFLCRIPKDFEGVDSIEVNGTQLVVTTKAGGARHELRLELGDLFQAQ
jgi:hypothetical protein